MTGALIILGFTVLTGLILFLTHKPDSGAGEQDSPSLSGKSEDAEVCCGLHAVCEKDLSPADIGPLYFDDEELDRFSGRQPDSYTEAETEEFREVLYTLLPADIYPWGVALTRRGVALPSSLRDEWLMLVNG